MRRLTDGILVIGLLVFSGFLYHIVPTLPLVSITERPPLAVAQPISGFERGNGLNLALQRSDLASTQWWLDRVTVNPNAGSAPDRSETANRLAETAESGLHRIETRLSGTTPSDVHTLSVFVRPSGRSSVQFEMRDSQGGKYGVVRYDLARQIVRTEMGDVTDSGLQALPDGWYRCWAGMPYATDAAVFNFALLRDDGANSYAGDGHSGLLIWGVQFERGDRLTGYSDMAAAK
jgi:hypothetical protein